MKFQQSLEGESMAHGAIQPEAAYTLSNREQGHSKNTDALAWTPQTY